MATNGVHIIVSGRVQGVGFRWMTKMVADKLHITGTVANQMDGSVEIYAVGASDQLAQFEAAVKASPTPSGRVTDYQETPLDPAPTFKNFDVIGWNPLRLQV